MCRIHKTRPGSKVGRRCLSPPCVFSSALVLSGTTLHTIYTSCYIRTTLFHGEMNSLSSTSDLVAHFWNWWGWICIWRGQPWMSYLNYFDQLLEPSFIVRKFNQSTLPFVMDVGNSNTVMWLRHYKHVVWCDAGVKLRTLCMLASCTLSYIPKPKGQVVKAKRESKSVQGSGGKILMTVREIRSVLASRGEILMTMLPLCLL